MAKGLIRPKQLYGPHGRLPVGHSKFYDDFVNTGRLRLVRLGPRSVAAVDTDVDALIDDLIIERDAAQLLLDSAADLNDRPGCAAVLRGMTYANERQKHHFLDRCIKTAKEIKAGAAPKPLPKSSKRSRAEVAA